jgi:DNA-binding SARP family transcriptional activator
MDRTPHEPLSAQQDGLRLGVLGQFSLRVIEDGVSRDVSVHPCGQRLLVLLAVHQRPVRRAWVSELLWGRSDQRHASWSLRAALHRLPQPGGRSPVDVVGDQLALSKRASVDLFELVLSTMSADPDTREPDGSVDPPGDGATWHHIAALERDVLPDWYEDWVVVERERHRQLRLHLLESLSGRLTAERRFGLAVQAGLAATKAEPLRETAHRAVIEAHVAQGNMADALRQYGICRRHLLDELGISPSRSLQELVFGDSGERAQGRVAAAP